MYEPPIAIVTGEIQTQIRDEIDRKIVEATQAVDIRLDKDRLLQLLKKDRPEKVRRQNRHGEGWDGHNKDVYSCPTCGRRLRNKQRDRYCGACGQHLDWEV